MFTIGTLCFPATFLIDNFNALLCCKIEHVSQESIFHNV